MNSRIRKITSVILIAILLLSCFPTGAFAVTPAPNEVSAAFTDSSEEAVLDTSRLLTPELLIETDEAISAVGADKVLERGHIARVPEREDNLNTLVYVNEDGSYTKYLFDYPVKYETADGKIRDVSLKLVSDNNGGFRSKEGNTTVTFSKNKSDGITLSGNSVTLKMKPAVTSDTSVKTNISTSPTLTDNSSVTLATVKQLDEKTVFYAYDSKTTLEYQLTYTGFKEDIVVSEYTGQTEYCFLLETGGLTLAKIDGSYYLTDENGEIKATIGDIIIFTADERNNALGSMSHVVVRENQQYIITIHVDAEYLSDENTKYPIRIDPTIEITYDNNGAGAIQDVTICSNGSYGGTSGSLYIGNRSDKGLCRALIKFPGLNFSSLGNIDVQSAYVEIRDLMCESTTLGLEARTFMGNTWSESTSTTWANVDPESSADLYSYNYITYATGNSLSPKHRYSFEITAAVSGWHSGFYSQDKGIIIQAIEEGDLYYGETYNYRTFASYNRASNKPSFVLNYVDYNNLEDPIGYLEQVTSTQIKGWTYRPDIPNTPINVMLYITDTRTNTTAKNVVITANTYRADLHSAGYGNGQHGFVYNINWDELLPSVYTITAYGIGGDGGTYALNGNPMTYAHEGLELSYYEITIDIGETFRVTPYVCEYGAISSATWYPTDSSIATISSTNVVTGVSPGTVTLMARSTYGQYSAYCVVNVRRDEDPFHPTNIEYIRYTRITGQNYGGLQGQADHTISIIKSHLLDNDYFIARDNINVGYSRQYVISDDMISTLINLEQGYQDNYSIIPAFNSTTEHQRAAHAAKLETDQLIEQGYIESGTSEYYGVWAYNYTSLLNLANYWNGVVSTATVVYETYLAISTFYYSYLNSTNTFSTNVSSTKYNQLSTHFDDIDDALAGVNYSNRTTLSAEERNLALSNLNPPYKAGTPVLKITQSQSTQYVRVYTESKTNRVGKWIMRYSDIQGLTPVEIQSKYALPYTPTHYCYVDVPSGKSLYVGVVGDNFGYTAGKAIQFELAEDIDEFCFGQEIPLP